MFLHSDCSFGGMTIEGSPLSPGKHAYHHLSGSFTNFLLGGSGSVTITNLAAPPPPTSIVNPSLQGGFFSASFQTANGMEYQVQYTTNFTLPASSWTTLTTVSGNGSLTNFTDTGASASSARYYRMSIR